MIGNSKIKVADFSEKYNALKFGEQQAVVEQSLTKITLLQDQLSHEEQKLMQLVRTFGLGILTS